MSKLVNFIKLPMKTKLVFMEAYILLGLSKIVIWKVNFKTITGVFGEVNHETEFTNEGIDLYQVKQVSTAIRTMSKYTFWDNKCLSQAYTAKIMLNRRKQMSTVYLGVKKEANGKMIAHAWLRCGEIYVVGGDGGKIFTITNKFV